MDDLLNDYFPSPFVVERIAERGYRITHPGLNYPDILWIERGPDEEDQIADHKDSLTCTLRRIRLNEQLDRLAMQIKESVFGRGLRFLPDIPIGSLLVSQGLRCNRLLSKTAKLGKVIVQPLNADGSLFGLPRRFTNNEAHGCYYTITESEFARYQQLHRRAQLIKDALK